MYLRYKMFFLLLAIIRVQMLNTLERDREVVESEQNTEREKKAETEGQRQKGWQEMKGDLVAVSTGVGKKVRTTLECRKMTRAWADLRRRGVCTDEGQSEEEKGEDDMIRTTLGSYTGAGRPWSNLEIREGRVAWKAVLSQTLRWGWEPAGSNFMPRRPQAES